MIFLTYIKIALRFLSRNKLISFINLLGLSIGIAAFTIIIFYVDYERDFENFQANRDRIFRICPNKIFVGTPSALGRLIAKDFPEVESVCRISRSSWAEKVTVKANENYFYENRFYFTDSTFFKTFDYELLYGEKAKILNDAYSVVISERLAVKYFADKNAIGKVIEFEEKPYVVKGVLKDIPLNSHLHFDIIAPFRGSRDHMFEDLKNNWGSWNYFTYIRFKPNVDIDAFHQKLIEFAKDEYQIYRKPSFFENLYFQPIQRIHVEMIRGNLEPPVNNTYLSIYFLVSIIILLVASINYINLSIATSLKRAKEVGLRKVMGAHYKKIRTQFLSESILFTVLALAFSFVFVETFIPVLNKWLGIYVHINYFNNKFIALCLLIIVWVGLISGSYPSFIISRLQPIRVLRSGFKGSKSNVLFRNVLIVLQFVISVCLIAAAITIYQQMTYIQNMNLGYDRHNVVNLSLHHELIKEKHRDIKSAFESNPNIIEASANSYNVTDRPFNQSLYYENNNEIQESWAWLIFVDKDFFETYNISLLKGETFPDKMSEVSARPFIINESAAKAIFKDEDPIGKRITSFNPNKMGYVAGVINDFNFRSLHHPIEPLVFTMRTRGYDYISLRLSAHNFEKTLGEIELMWNELYPNYPFEYTKVELEYNKLYQTENQTSLLILIFTVLSIFISCLGLFGINSLVAKYRIREISVRKVFGASLKQIIMVLSKQTLKLVLLANLFAWPLAYFLMDAWLNNFTYRINVQWWVLLVSMIVSFLIALFTISFQSLKTAKTNPADTLKFE